MNGARNIKRELRNKMRNSLDRKFFIANIVIFALGILCLIYYDYHGGLWLKGVTSSWFFLHGLINLVYAKKIGFKETKVLYVIEIGLFLGMLADVLLGINFMVGVAAFALGHVFYIVAYNMIERPCLKDLYFVIPISAISINIVTLTPFINVEDPIMEKVLIAYAIIISWMLGKAISNLMTKQSIFTWIVGVGSLLFLFSDLILAIDMFGESSRLTWILCSYTYWPAQHLLAQSMYNYINDKKGTCLK